MCLLGDGFFLPKIILTIRIRLWLCLTISSVLKMRQSTRICILIFHIVFWSGIGGNYLFVRRFITIMLAYCVSRRLIALITWIIFSKMMALKVFTRFTLLHQEDIEFQQFGLRNNVAQLCILEVKRDKLESDACSPTILNRRFLVGNIHVLFNPKRGDIKLGQVRLFVDKAYKLSQEWGNIPVILAGDLNSVPQSAIYEFLASSKLDIQLYNRRNMSGQLEASSNCRVFRSQVGYEASISMSVSRQLVYRWSEEELELATGAEGVTHLQSHLKLHSAYASIPGNNKTRDDIGEPLATSYHSKFMGTVDYIWHTKELVPVRVLETLPIDILRATKGLPSEKWGSDHLALVCEFAFANYEDGS
ncbi:carbon catabolite repressor protein 4 homolog 5-like isoform X4 [Prosopis cineraria]|uniref:carbon catabolite repressor protein 4 homolog 5-like isoform X4 n=1 Tax=Prosopis cineraria TaxID=364024 RepID=UPI002410B28E|nr:carbon catabolite repressor protein 4 homolog 5-like isoform X4 [Prosopis cineraria]